MYQNPYNYRSRYLNNMYQNQYFENYYNKAPEFEAKIGQYYTTSKPVQLPTGYTIPTNTRIFIHKVALTSTGEELVTIVATVLKGGNLVNEMIKDIPAKQLTRQTTGKLLVFLFEGNKANPISGATVTITGNNQNMRLQTNAFGQTQTVTLPAHEPYSVYSVNVSASGYNTVKVDGVQVIPNSTGIQEIQMTPQRGNYRTQGYNFPT